MKYQFSTKVLHYQSFLLPLHIKYIVKHTTKIYINESAKSKHSKLIGFLHFICLTQAHPNSKWHACTVYN